MSPKKITQKARLGSKVLREEGVLNFGIKSLQHIQKIKHNRTTKLANKTTKKDPIYTCVRYEDAISVNLLEKRSMWRGADKKTLHFNWIMPPPGKGSGGHLNIYRFIKYLENAGHECRIYLYSQGAKSKISDVKRAMGDSYPELKASMEWLLEDNKMEPADGTFATSWETAYPLYNTKNNTKRFYFVQDFEPYFYPASSLFELAENTYRFGFYGVTAGKWLATKLHNDFDMDTDYFDFGSDEKLYSYDNAKSREEIFCYVRPYTERRGFELAIMALDIFHRKHPNFKINLVGWDVSNYDIPFAYNNLKTLELDQLNGLYNRCVVGLVISLTNMSLLPLELLGSGTIPVVNDGDNNKLVSNNKYIAYSKADPQSLANKLSEVVLRPDIIQYAKSAANSVKTSTWADSGNKFVTIVERETRKHE